MLPSLLMTALWVMMPHPSTNAVSAAADCVSHGTTREQLRRANVVFVGDVTAIRGLGNEGLTVVTFDVVEAFKGVRRGEQVLRFVNSLEGFAFREESVRVLVVAFRDGEIHSTSCSLSQVVAPDDPILSEVRRNLRRPR